MKLSLIYDSKTGNTQAAAEAIAAGMMKAGGVEARCFRIPEVDADFVNESAGIVVGSPTYAAGLTPDLYDWLMRDSMPLIWPAGKLGGAFATGQYIHGGEDLTIQFLLTHLLVRGMMVYSGGNAFGHPVVHIGPVAISPDKEGFRELFEIYGERFAAQAKKIKE